MPSLTSSDLIEGATYSGKRQDSGTRTIQSIDGGIVCYNGSTLLPGAQWPKIPVWQFLLWAKECVDLPADLPIKKVEESVKKPEFNVDRFNDRSRNPRRSRDYKRILSVKRRRGFDDD
jgi:hypothetical protein